jgi:hypothetical protein
MRQKRLRDGCPGVRPNGGRLKMVMKALANSLLVSLLWDGASALAQPTKAEVDQLVERYQPRLDWLTAEAIESVWRERLQDEPWYRKIYGHWAALKDDPHMLRKLKGDRLCAETEPSNRDTTFQGFAKQYRCTGAIRERRYSGETVFYANLDASGLLASAVLYARIPLPFPFRGIARDQETAMRELHSEMSVRMDNARAPPGAHVEYSPDLDHLKFAAQFR